MKNHIALKRCHAYYDGNFTLDFSFDFINFVNLSTFFIQRFFYFFHKKRVFNVFYFGGQRFLHLLFQVALLFFVSVSTQCATRYLVFFTH